MLGWLLGIVLFSAVSTASSLGDEADPSDANQEKLGSVFAGTDGGAPSPIGH
jgi:hypothetical protein